MLILDEATSHLDPPLEQQLVNAIRKQRQGKPTLWITHRLAGIAGLDKIFVLDHGQLVEQGTHAELLAAGGLYAHLWALQQTTE